MFPHRYFAVRFYSNGYFNGGGDQEPIFVPSEDQYWMDVIGFRMIGG